MHIQDEGTAGNSNGDEPAPHQTGFTSPHMPAFPLHQQAYAGEYRQAPPVQENFSERFIARMGARWTVTILFMLLLTTVTLFVTVVILNGAVHRMERQTWVNAGDAISGAVSLMLT